jgi:molecular chaperone HscB
MPDFNASHFELFGLPATYRLDPARLDSAYREWQNQVHPDRFAVGSDMEKRLSMQWATRVNEAYQTLRAPLSRADYLLSLRGVDALAATNTHMPAAFLMRQMEWREAIAEARQAHDAAGLDDIQADIRRETRVIEQRLAECLDDKPDPEHAAVAVRELKFMHKLADEVLEAHEALA